MFSFIRSNTYTVDGLKNMRSSISNRRARMNERITKMENSLYNAKHDAITGRQISIQTMRQEIDELEQL